MRLRFGDVTFDGGRRLLFRGPLAVHLSPKAFQLLGLLLARRPAAVSKSEIQEALWPDTFVSEGNLATLVNEVRQALGESARSPTWVRTAFGFGYAFDGAVREEAEARPAPHRHILVWGKQELELAEGENVLGRERHCGVWVGHASVSREHARITVAGERAEIEDLGSKNGTWRGTERVTGGVLLADGDEVRVGSVSLTSRGLAAGFSSETKSVP